MLAKGWRAHHCTFTTLGARAEGGGGEGGNPLCAVALRVEVGTVLDELKRDKVFTGAQAM